MQIIFITSYKTIWTSLIPQSTKKLISITKNESVLERMKDEYAGIEIFKCYGTDAKAYCINTDNKIDKKAKDAKKYLISYIWLKMTIKK